LLYPEFGDAGEARAAAGPPDLQRFAGNIKIFP
jgi:hypothetical protein